MSASSCSVSASWGVPCRVSAHVAHNSVGINDLPVLIGSVHAALAGLGSSAAEEPVERNPTVPVKSSIKPDYIVCLEDGVKLKMLKRHLMTHHGLTPETYRARWNLPANYPMVSPNYSAARSASPVKNAEAGGIAGLSGKYK